MTKPFLYDIVNTLYHGVMDIMPQFLQDSPMASAFVLGTGGIYGVVRGFQAFSKKFVSRVIPHFDKELLPKLEKVCIAGMAVAPVLYAFIDPERANEIMAQHPVYTSGMAGVYLGSIVGAVQDLHKRSKSLDEVVSTKEN